MKKLIIIILICTPILSFSQQTDYKTYDKIVDLIELGNLEKAKKLTLKLIDKSEGWNQAHLLMSNIYFKEGDISESSNSFLSAYPENEVESALPIFLLGEKYFEAAYYSSALQLLKISENLLKQNLIEWKNSDKKNKHSYAGEINKNKRLIANCQFSIDAMKNPLEFKFENMGENINTENAEYLPFISADDEFFILTRRMEKEGMIDQEDFFISYKSENEKWQKQTPMSINTLKNEGAITISADEMFLVYTACDRDGGIGSCDLYICVKIENGEWSDAMNLGNVVNSKAWDSQSCFSPDGKYLYFISNREGGFGGKDIWRTELTRFGFSEPKNLGENINTKHDEMSPFLHHDNLTFYFASKGHTGMGDYDLFVSRRENTDSDWGTQENLGYPINSNKVENSLVVSSDGKTAYFVSNNSGFGKEDIFTFQLPKEKRATEISELEKEIITQLEGEEIILENVLFEINSFVLMESSFDELGLLIDYLKKNLSVKIHIEGHTDNVGKKTDNQILSENRAKAVYNYLYKNRINSNRLTFKGYGESKEIASNSTEKGREKNRRTSFVIKR